ncbi:MAG: DUF4340 domain-containing protein [Planctomycetes bacterium]|nr:DUF4340 domain-containing protein [Planctomycetota bacterium]
MNFRLTAVLFGSIFVLGLVLLILSFTGGEKTSTDVILEELAATKPEQIDTVEFERDGGAKLKLVRDKTNKDAWEIVEPYKAKADSAAVTELVTALLKAKPTPIKGQLPNMATAGLDKPGLKVTLRHGERFSTANFGHVVPLEKVVFVSTSARPKRPMAVSRASVESLFREPNKDGAAGDLAKWVGDFRDKRVFTAETRGAGDDVIGVTLKAKGKTLSLVQPPSKGWKFADPKDWGDADPTGDSAPSPGTFTGVRPLLGALTSLQALSGADFIENPTPQDMEKYGLAANSPERIEVKLTNKDKVETVAFIGKKDDAPQPKQPGALPQTGKWWVQVQGQPGVIRANGGDLSGLTGVIENPDPLRDRNLLTVEKARIDGLDLANGAVKLRKVGGALAAWKLYGYPSAGDPQVATIVDVDRVINTLTERRTIKSFPAPNEANFGPGSLTLKVWVDGFEANTDAKADPKAEPKEKGKPITLTFGKVEGDLVNVKRVLADGSTEFFMMPTKIKLGSSPDPVDVLQTVNKTRLDFLDRDLKTFSSTNVAKLIVQGVVTFDLDREAKAEGSAGDLVFRFAADARGPAGQVYKKGDQADTQTVLGMLDFLATTPTVTRFVDETPTPEKLAEYGLGTATRLRVTVGLKGTAPDDKERVYEFGKETADPNFVYAKVGGKAAVFTLPKFLYDKFPTADLRNKLIFKINPAEVSRIEITGWGHVFGKPGELVFEKNKEGVWVATKAPTAGYVADTNRVAQFLKMLENLQVRSFTNDNVMEPKHKLNDEKELFVVTLANATGGHHMHLRLGGPADANGTTLYAFTNRVPDGKPIITVDAAPFKPYKEGTAAFAK